MFPPRIADYYEAALKGGRVDVQNMPEADTVNMDTEEWVRHLVTKYAMEPLKVDLGAITLEETSRGGYAAILVSVPVEPSETFDIIANRALVGGGAWLGFDYQTFFNPHRPYTIGQVEEPEQNHVNVARRRIAEYIQSLRRCAPDRGRRRAKDSVQLGSKAH